MVQISGFEAVELRQQWTLQVASQTKPLPREYIVYVQNRLLHATPI